MSGNKVNEDFLNFVMQKKNKIKKTYEEVSEEVEEKMKIKKIFKKVLKIEDIEGQAVEKNENNQNDGSLKAFLSKMTGTVVNKVVEGNEEEESSEAESEDDFAEENYNHYARNHDDGEDPLLTDSSNYEEDEEDEEEEPEEDEEEKQDEVSDQKTQQGEERKKIECEIFAENIPTYKDEKQIIKFFKNLNNKIVRVKVLKNNENGKSKGKAFLKFFSLKDAQAFLNKNVTIDQNQITFSLVKQNNNSNLDENNFNNKKNQNNRNQTDYKADKFNTTKERHSDFKNTTLVSNSVNNNSHTAFITNLPLILDESSIMKNFKQFGKISNIRLMKNAEGKLKGFGYIDFENEASLNKAIEKTKSVMLEGKEIVVEKAKSSFNERVYEDSKRLGKKKMRAEQNKNNNSA